MTRSAMLKVASWAGRSEHTGHDPPPHPGCIPRIDGVLSQRLLLVGRPDEKCDIRGRQRRKVPPTWVRDEEGAVGKQIAEVDRVAHQAVEPRRHNPTVDLALVSRTSNG